MIFGFQGPPTPAGQDSHEAFNFDQQKCLNNHMWELPHKCKFGPLYFSSKWTKVSDSNSFKMDESCNLTCDQKLCSNLKL